MRFTKKITEFIFLRLPTAQQDFLFSLKRFNLGRKKFPPKQILIMKVDGKHFHGGLADRLKGMVSLYHYCLTQNIEFRIDHTFPFELSNYLIPNEYDWQIKDSDKITFHLLESKYFHLVGDRSIKRLVKLKTNKQIHCYANRDYVESLNEYYNTNFDWGNLFRKLFNPTEKLKAVINNNLAQIGGEYICAVFRFQQLLGDFNEYYCQGALTENEKKELIKKCKEAIITLQNNSKCKKILVTSDSQLFLQSLKNLDNIYTFPNKKVHVDVTENESYDVYMQSFVDFYMLSEGIKIYSLGTDIMYKTEFPLYAAKLNNIPFERILIK